MGDRGRLSARITSASKTLEPGQVVTDVITQTYGRVPFSVFGLIIICVYRSRIICAYNFRTVYFDTVSVNVYWRVTRTTSSL